MPQTQTPTGLDDTRYDGRTVLDWDAYIASMTNWPAAQDAMMQALAAGCPIDALTAAQEQRAKSLGAWA